MPDPALIQLLAPADEGEWVVDRTAWRTRKVLGRPWQDVLFSAGGVVFLVSLVPLLFTHAHIPPFTGIATGAVLFAFSAAQASYRNWLALIVTAITATVWMLLGLGVSL